MDKKKDKKRKLPKHMGIFVILGTLVALAVAFSVLSLKVSHDANTPFTTAIDASLPQESSNYIVNTIISKYWVNNEGTDAESYGAQYDTTVRNNTDYDIIKWKIEIDVPDKDELHIDSYWNGMYEYKDGKLIWQAVRSCFGSGVWIGSKPWIGEEKWKGQK